MKQFIKGEFDAQDKLNENFEEINASLSDLTYKIATGTTTTILLTTPTLVDGYTKTFIASANNNGSATTINGKSLYKPNTTTAPNLTGGKAYTIWYDSTKNCFFIKASAEGNTITSHVLANDTFSTDIDTGLVGTMANNGAVIITPSTVNQVIPKDYHNGNGYVVGDSDLISANIKAGVNIFNVQGKASVVDTVDATAVATDILNTKTAYVNSSKVTGNIPVNPGLIAGTNHIQSGAGPTIGKYSPDGQQRIYVRPNIVGGRQCIDGDVSISLLAGDLFQENIISGKTILGIVGNSPDVKIASGTTNATSINNGGSIYYKLNIATLVPFVPKIVFGYNTISNGAFSCMVINGITHCLNASLWGDNKYNGNINLSSLDVSSSGNVHTGTWDTWTETISWTALSW